MWAVEVGVVESASTALGMGEGSMKADVGGEDVEKDENEDSVEGRGADCRLILPRTGEAGEGKTVETSIKLGADAFWFRVILLRRSIFVSLDLALPLKFLRSLGLDAARGGTLGETAEAQAEDGVVEEEIDDRVLVLDGRGVRVTTKVVSGSEVDGVALFVGTNQDWRIEGDAAERPPGV